MPKLKVTQKIIIELDKITLELTEEQAKELLAELEGLVGADEY